MEITAAPLALKDEVIIGGSGGDNGVRCWLASLDAKTGKLKWKTFAVPGAGRARQRDLEGQGQRLADRRRRVLCDGFVRSCDQPDLLGLRQSRAALRFRLPARRQPLHQQHDRVRRRDRQDYLVFPAHGERQPRLRFERVADHHRRQDRRRGSQALGARQPQRLQLHGRPAKRPVPQGGAIRRQGHLDQGHRSQDRQAGRLRSGQGRAELRIALEGRHRRPQECLPRRARRHQFLAAGLQPEDAASLHRRQRGLRQHHARPHGARARQVRRRQLCQRGADHGLAHGGRSRPRASSSCARSFPTATTAACSRPPAASS